MQCVIISNGVKVEETGNFFNEIVSGLIGAVMTHRNPRFMEFIPEPLYNSVTSSFKFEFCPLVAAITTRALTPF